MHATGCSCRNCHIPPSDCYHALLILSRPTDLVSTIYLVNTIYTKFPFLFFQHAHTRRLFSPLHHILTTDYRAIAAGQQDAFLSH